MSVPKQWSSHLRTVTMGVHAGAPAVQALQRAPLLRMEMPVSVWPYQPELPSDRACPYTVLSSKVPITCLESCFIRDSHTQTWKNAEKSELPLIFTSEGMD